MASIQLPVAPVFDGFPEPVFLIEGANVRYVNHAGVVLFPGTEVDGALPAALEALLEGAAPPAVLCARLEGRPWQVSLQESAGGTLVILRPQTEAVGPRLDRITGQFRRHMAAMNMAVQRLDPERVELDLERTQRYVSIINQGIYQLTRLCDHLEFLEGPAFRPEALDVAGFMEELAGQLEGICGAGGWDFRYQSELTGVLTMADRRLLQRLVLALVSNAMKAVGPGGSLGMDLSRRKGWLHLVVWDRGHGLKEEDLARLFDAGQSPADLDPNTGLGLGLDAARRVAALHGGRLMVGGGPGQGVRAAVALPIREPGPDDLGLSTPRGVDDGFSRLLVELSDVLPARCYTNRELEETC